MIIPKKTAKTTLIPAQPIPTQELNVKQAAKRKSKAQEATIKMRQLLFPWASDENLWVRTKNDGYTTMPRTMPLLMNLINDMSKSVSDGKSIPAGKAYLALWCRVFDEGMVKIDNEAAAAVEAGYTGERNVTTWREHMRVLKDLDFIAYEEGPSSPCQYILIRNPYNVLRERKDQIQKATYTAICQRAIEIGAGKDMGL
jgi:hypothetical protein